MRYITANSFIEMGNIVNDLLDEGYDLKEKDETSARLKKTEYSSAMGQMILLVLVGWWTLLIPNIALFLWNYFGKSDDVFVRLDDEIEYNPHPKV